ncbi:MAG: aldose epimerase family protein [Chthoniobacteraceae bacterium]
MPHHSIVSVVLSIVAASTAFHAQGKVERAPVTNGSGRENVEVFTLTNDHGLQARAMTWGATLIGMKVPDREGKLADITLGFDDPARYLQPHPLFGSIAGRYANRIARGRFELDGKMFQLPTNNGVNHIHGGMKGFDQRNWTGEPVGDNAVRFRYVSPDGEEGYPGELNVSVTYTLTNDDELRIAYEAETTAPTILNLTNHSYWNLAGKGDVLSHELAINGGMVNEVDEGMIPTGTFHELDEGPLDFRKAKPIGRDIRETPASIGGYDHCYVITHSPNGTLGESTLAATLHDPASGRTMKVWTDQPAVQLYTANHLKDLKGRAGQVYGRHAGVCLETQHFPDSPNHPDFPSTVLRPGETFRTTTVFAFSAGKD